MEIEKPNPISQTTLVPTFVFVVIKVYVDSFRCDFRVGLRIVDISSEKQIYGLIVTQIRRESLDRATPC